MGNNPLSQIIFLIPAFVHKIWGSQKLAHKFNFDLPKNTAIGEAWLISAHPNGMSYVLNGTHKGLSLAQLFKDFPHLFGNPHEAEYPLLTKILDANDSLSVQIHPDDEYAQKHHQSLGKTECWYVLDCLPEPKGQVILGHFAKTKDQFKQWVYKGQWNKLLKYVPIKEGQFIYVPSLKIHGLLAHTMVFELQQSSDITYRLYDYDRRDDFGNPRVLHLKEAEDIIITPDKDNSDTNAHDNYLVDNQFYKLIKITNDGIKNYSYPDVRWLQVSVLDGKGTIDGEPIKKGDSFILPHGYNSFTLDGNLMMMISYC
ncbi:type I phosphomannose isomerase catalytic subunit [Spiroplasma endosymbiont of Virgichneumon dumeticola]|uniref:type I phosphomannose isomerase catalytic subunit n=1 Tax=Spiroplasma endosymbiont of Virgichneumon dumeticola TaxID=3139323 RepID=UPI0035C8BEEF